MANKLMIGTPDSKWLLKSMNTDKTMVTASALLTPLLTFPKRSDYLNHHRITTLLETLYNEQRSLTLRRFV